MPYHFSALADGSELHIRATSNRVYRSELIDERPHKHYFVEFHYVYEGEETLFFPVGEKRVPVTAGEIAMIPKGLYHCAETSGHKTVTRLCFDFEMEPEENRNDPLFQAYQSLASPLVFRDPFITGALERCREIIENGPDSTASPGRSAPGKSRRRRSCVKNG